MAMQDGGTYGYKRLVVGAHYGWRDFLVQRMSGAIMGVYTLILLLMILFSKGPLTYSTWSGIFAHGWMKFLTFVVIASVIWHAWIGMLSIWYDYGKPTGVRLALQVVTAVWLVGCLGWALQVLWRL